MKKWPTPSKNIEAFFAAMEIPNGRNRAIVCTGKAHAMSMLEIDETIERLECHIQERLQKFIELRAPQIVIDMESKNSRSAAALKLLRRVKKQKEEK